MPTIVHAGTQLGSASTSFTGSAATNIDKNNYRESIMIQNQSTSPLYMLFAESGTPSSSNAHHVLPGCGSAKDGTGGVYTSVTYRGAIRTSAVDKTVSEFVF